MRIKRESWLFLLCGIVFLSSNALYADNWGAVSDVNTFTPSGSQAQHPRVGISADGSLSTVVWSNLIDPTGPSNVQSASIFLSTTSSWGPAKNLSASGGVSVAEVAFSSDGAKAFAVWGYSDGTNLSGLQSSIGKMRNQTATWGAAQSTGVPGSTTRTALSNDGTKGVILWVERSGGVLVIRSKTSIIGEAGGTFGDAFDLGVSDSDTFLDFDLSMSGDGSTIVAIFAKKTGSQYSIRSRTAQFQTNIPSWGPEVTVHQSSSELRSPKLFVSKSGGTALAIWRKRDAQDAISSSVAVMNGGTTTWDAPTNVSTMNFDSGDAVNPQIAANSDASKFAVVWSEYRSATARVIKARSGSLVGGLISWAAPENLSTEADFNVTPQLAYAGDGSRVVVVWSTVGASASGSNSIQARSAVTRSGALAWGDLSIIRRTALSENLRNPDVAITPDGLKAIVVWVAKVFNQSVAHRIVQSSTGMFGTSRIVTGQNTAVTVITPSVGRGVFVAPRIKVVNQSADEATIRSCFRFSQFKGPGNVYGEILSSKKVRKQRTRVSRRNRCVTATFSRAQLGAYTLAFHQTRPKMSTLRGKQVLFRVMLVEQ